VSLVVLAWGDAEVVGAGVVVVGVGMGVGVVEKVTMGRVGSARGTGRVRYHTYNSHIMVQNQLELTRGSP
jgi:hypothetical protein